MSMREELVIKQALGIAGAEVGMLPNSINSMRTTVNSITPEMFANLKAEPERLEGVSFSEGFRESLGMFFAMQDQIENTISNGFDPMEYARNHLLNPTQTEMPGAQSMDYDELD